MKRLSPKDELKWVCHDARLPELMEKYPEEWQSVGPELVTVFENGRPQVLADYCTKAKLEEETWHHRISRSRNNSKVIESALPHLIKSRMFLLAMDRCYQAAALGTEEQVRLNLVNGYIIQKLLFLRHLTRKPASLKWFRFWWRFVGQKRVLMPLVQPRGIYCFYSQELIRELHALIGSMACLEIGAGDGTLTKFLADNGARINATDDHSWRHVIEYPENVEKLGAKQALAKYEPQAVICSWPPPGNSFEEKVFSTKSVEIYIVIGSQYRFASGNWDSYAAQNRFDWCIDPKLSSLVIPPELESAVLIFRKRST